MLARVKQLSQTLCIEIRINDDEGMGTMIDNDWVSTPIRIFKNTHARLSSHIDIFTFCVCLVFIRLGRLVR